MAERSISSISDRAAPKSVWSSSRTPMRFSSSDRRWRPESFLVEALAVALRENDAAQLVAAPLKAIECDETQRTLEGGEELKHPRVRTDVDAAGVLGRRVGAAAFRAPLQLEKAQARKVFVPIELVNRAIERVAA